MMTIITPLSQTFAVGGTAAGAVGGTASTAAGKSYLVTSNGLITSHKIATDKCDFLVDFSERMKQKHEETKTEEKLFEADGMFDIFGKLNEFIVDIGVGIVVWSTDVLVNMGSAVCKSENADMINMFFNQTQVFTKNVNITYVGNLMSIIGIVQWLALMGMSFFLLYKGWLAITGKFSLSPINMIIRFSASMMLIYLAPYLLQDILGINNLIVHQFSNMTVNLDGITVKISEVIPASLGIILFQIKDMMINFSGTDANVGQQIWAFSTRGISLVVTIIFALIMLILTIRPLFALISWWYTRFFKIFLFAVLSPIMFMTFSTEETEGTGYRFLRNFTIAVFEQFFMVLGIGIMGVFFTTIMPIMNTLGLGFFGYAIAFYAAVHYLSQLPLMLDSWFVGISRVDNKNHIGDMTREAVGTYNKARDGYSRRMSNSERSRKTSIKTASTGPGAGSTGGSSALRGTSSGPRLPK